MSTDHLRAAWESASKAERSAFMKEQRATKLAAKKARRAQRELEMAQTTRRLNELNAPPATLIPGTVDWYIVGWLGDQPIVQQKGSKWAKWGHDWTMAVERQFAGHKA